MNRLDGPWMPRPPHPTLQAFRRWGRRLLAVAVVAGVGFAVHRPAIEAYCASFKVDDPVASDVMVLLLGGPDHRPRRVAELYRAGIAPKVIYCTSADPLAEFTGETETTARILAKYGVPREAQVLLPDTVTSTQEEALAVRAYLLKHPAASVLVVTSDFHTRRARWIFRRTLEDLNVRVEAAAARPPFAEGEGWFMRDESLIMYFIESVKMLVYRVRY